MAVAIEGYTRQSTNGTATSITLVAPSNIIIGELLLLLVGNENSANNEGFDEVTGFTKIIQVGSGTEDTYAGAYWRIADGTEDVSVVVPFLGGDDGFGWYARLSGVAKIANPIANVRTAAAVDSTIPVNGAPNPITGSLDLSLVSFDGSDSGTFTINNSWNKIDQLESPDPSDSGGAASGAFATWLFTVVDSSQHNWTAAVADGIVALAFTIEAIAVSYGSASLKRDRTFEHTTPIITVQPSIKRETKATTYQTISFPMWEQLAFLGKASLNRASLFTVEGLIQDAPITGKASLNRNSSFTVSGDWYSVAVFGAASLLSRSTFVAAGYWYNTGFYGSANITRDSILTAEGVFIGPSYGTILDSLEDKVTLIEDILSEAPTNTDFLKPEDIASFFTASERGILYGL